MCKVTLLLWSLAIVGLLRSADGCEVKTYTQKLVPACDTNDLIIKWPNYEDQTKYYKCIQVNNAQLIDCPSGQVFVYVLQTCKPCADYLPAVECSKLPTQNTPVCVDINAGSGGGSSGGGSESSSATGTVTYPTPRYPSPATTTPVSSDSTTSSGSSGSTSSAGDESSVEPSEDSTSTAESTAESATTTTAFPGPPSPQATGGTTLVPIPPTPAPTPPVIELVPPTASD